MTTLLSVGMTNRETDGERPLWRTFESPVDGEDMRAGVGRNVAVFCLSGLRRRSEES